MTSGDPDDYWRAMPVYATRTLGMPEDVFWNGTMRDVEVYVEVYNSDLRRRDLGVSRLCLLVAQALGGKDAEKLTILDMMPDPYEKVAAAVVVLVDPDAAAKARVANWRAQTEMLQAAMKQGR